MMGRYPVGGLEWPSVTEIIGDCTDKSNALTYWAANCVVEWIKQNCDIEQDWIDDDGYEFIVYNVDSGELKKARNNFRDVSQTALDVGGQVHNAIEQYLLTGKEPELEGEQAERGFVAFIDWADRNKMKTEECELKVYGAHWAGMLDWVGRLNGVRTVIDFKTSKAVYPEYRYQIAAYRSCTGAEASGILRLDKTTAQPEYKDYSKSYEKDLAVFGAMVNLYFLRHPRIAKAAGVPF